MSQVQILSARQTARCTACGSAQFIERTWQDTASLSVYPSQIIKCSVSGSTISVENTSPTTTHPLQMQSDLPVPVMPPRGMSTCELLAELERQITPTRSYLQAGIRIGVR